MEEQGKRLLLAVVIALGLMLVWNYFFPPAKPPAKPPATAPATAPAKPATAVTPTPAKVRGAEQRIPFQLGELKVEFSSYGGSIRSWGLTGAQFKDRKTGAPRELLPPPSPEIGGALTVGFLESPELLPLDAEWQVADKTERGVTFVWQNQSLKVEKIFELVPAEFRVNLTVRITNLSQEVAKQSLAVMLFGFQDPDKTKGGGMGQQPQVWGAVCHGSDHKRVSINDLLDDGPVSLLGARWAGIVHSYFLVAVAPDTLQEPMRERINCSVRALPARGGMRAEVTYPLAAVAAGEVYERSMTAYFGPKFLDTLEQLSARLTYKPELDAAVDLGFWGFLARPLLWLLTWFQSFVINWGIAIVLLTITVKLATLYWTHKSMRSMQEMAKLRPQLEKLKEKYADDKQRQQIETMNLFKAHNVNPVAGCLPMLLQMPVWFALYRSLNVAAELHHAPFIHGWIEDLTAADPYYILPILLTGMMFLQSRLTPQTATGAQQKMLMYGMPLMFGVFSFFFPAGLTLYILTNTVLSALHSLYMYRGRRNAPAPAPAPETEPSAESRGSTASGSKKKKRKKRN